MSRKADIQMKKHEDGEYIDLYPKTVARNVQVDEALDLATDLSLIKTPDYYDEITYQEFYDPVSESYYQITRIPHLDKNGERIKLSHGFARDNIPSSDGQPAREYSMMKNASFVMNASRYSPTTLLIHGVQIKDGIIYNSTPHQYSETLGIMPDGTLRSFANGVSAEAILQAGVKDALTGFYAIIEGGVGVSPARWQDNDPDLVHPRQVIGQLSNKDIIVLSIEGRIQRSKGATYPDLQRLMLQRGCVFAYVLDGGGSVQTVVRGSLITTQTDDNGYRERPVKDYIYIEPRPNSTGKEIGYHQDIAYLSKKLSDVKGQLDNLIRLNNKGYMYMDSPADNNVQGIIMERGGERYGKLFLREGDMGWYDYSMDEWVFRVHEGGNLQTNRGQIADIFSTAKRVDNLNDLDVTTVVWSQGGHTLNSPDTAISWLVENFKYDSTNRLQRATPYHTGTQYKTMIRRSSSSGGYTAWREA